MWSYNRFRSLFICGLIVNLVTVASPERLRVLAGAEFVTLELMIAGFSLM
jgi:hypothetical protein